MISSFGAGFLVRLTYFYDVLDTIWKMESNNCKQLSADYCRQHLLSFNKQPLVDSSR
jgi:hypothetical protein